MLYEITVFGFLLLAACLLSWLVAFMARATSRDSEQIRAGLAAVRGESMVLWAFVGVGGCGRRGDGGGVDRVCGRVDRVDRHAAMTGRAGSTAPRDDQTSDGR